MQSKATTPAGYIAELSPERGQAISDIWEAVNANIPEGFVEHMGSGMLGWVVPHSLYPPGYHCDPSLPLPLIGLASQKHFIALYHMGMTVDDDLRAWFEDEWSRAVSTKLDMGKSCIRLKKLNNIPIALIGELAAKMTVDDWVRLYERAVRR
jgi:hypothetical protein